ncbi:YceI family protein [Crocinitomicaceae bacterium]|nr:YceI family protein [Crocinitomicaceae bacterium]
MKRTTILLIGLIGLAITSCSSEQQSLSDTDNKKLTYTIDLENSSIKWKGQMSPEYGHAGTLNFSEGVLNISGETVVDGQFTVDMTTLKNTDLNPQKGEVLVGHLTGNLVDENHPADMFFNVVKFPNISVSINGYKNNTLDLTLLILGKELKQSVAATVTTDPNRASITGDFTLDLTLINIPGLQPNPDGSQISPVIEFEVAISLEK